jgi:hypothetical protein
MDQRRFEAAIRTFDEANGKDPNIEWVNGKPWPKELWYAGELTRWIQQLKPNASEALRLAARSQHIERWKIPRDSYPRDRMGYLTWRKALAKFHARRAGEILSNLGYSPEFVKRVQELNLKVDIKHDAETQTLEDGLCLVFLASQLGELASKTEEGKMIQIIRKTWKKMSAQAQKVALGLELNPAGRALVEKALASPESASQ